MFLHPRHNAGFLLSTDHTAASVGLIVEENGKKLVYTSDTRPIPAETRPAERADVLIHEASGSSVNEEILVKKGHSSGKDAAELANAMNAGELFICHLPMDSAAQREVEGDALRIFRNTLIPLPLKKYCVM